MATNHQMSEEWKQLVNKLEHKIISEENLAFMQKEESALKLRTKEKECDSLRDHMKSVIAMNRKLTNELHAAIEEKNKLSQQLSAANSIIHELKLGIKSKYRIKSMGNLQKKVQRQTSHYSSQTNGKPVNVFANHSDNCVTQTSKVYAITVQNPLSDKAHIFYQFSPDSTPQKLYKTVSDHFRVNNFELGCLTYKKIDTNSTDATLKQNGIYSGIHLFVIDSDKAPKSGQLLHAMLGTVFENDTALRDNRKQVSEERDSSKSQTSSERELTPGEVSIKSAVIVNKESARKVAVVHRKFDYDEKEIPCKHLKVSGKDWNREDSELFNKIKREKALRKLHKIEEYKRLVHKYGAQRALRISGDHTGSVKSLSYGSISGHSSSSNVISDRRRFTDSKPSDDNHFNKRCYRNVGYRYKINK